MNERTVDILHEVMECNEERDRDVLLLIEDMKDQATKYEAEGEFEAPFLSSIRVRLFLVILKIVFIKNLGIYVIETDSAFVLMQFLLQCITHFPFS